MNARLVISTAAAVGATLAVAAGASGAPAAGGGSIASAPVIPLGQEIQGDLGSYQNNYNDYYQGEFFKVNLQAGDRVQIRVESAGNAAPCPDVYPPGTDDFNFNPGNNEVPNQNWNVNTNHFLSTFIAGRTGTYVIGMNNDNDYCSGAETAAYTFEVLAPHYLRLSMPTSRTVRSGQTLTVGVFGALAAPVTDSTLRITLSGVWGGGAPKPIGHTFAQSGRVVFTLHVPSSLRGRHVRLIASGGDGVHWIGVSAGRSYLVR
jgi:hypothetical protein